MRKKIDLSQATHILRGFYREKKRAPSYAEIARLVGYRSKNAVFWLVQKLKKKGVLQADTKGRLLLESLFGIKVLGAVQAGFPSPAEEELVDTLSLDEYLTPHPERSYLVKVSGDSMVEAGIREGDLVIVERGRQPKNDDIVVAQVDGEWTMKYYQKTTKGVTLTAANKKYPPLSPKQELVIGGVVVAVIRKYK